MAQYPINDPAGLYEAVNYLASGTAGLGQQFAGFNSYTEAYLTGNFRKPFTIASFPRAVTGLSGEYTLIVKPNITGIVIGQIVSGKNIAVGAVVTNIDQTYNTITLSLANTDDVDTVAVFTPPTVPLLYVAPIALSTSEMLDNYTWKHTFASAQPSPPFINGNNVTVEGVDDDTYNGRYRQIGVVSCTTTYVICRTPQYYDIVPPSPNGTVALDSIVPSGTYVGEGYDFSTDANARVTVQGGQDRVVAGSQLLNTISYTATTSSDLNYVISINRYSAFPNSDPVNPDFLFQFDKTVFSRTYSFTGLTGTATLDPIETIFSPIIDDPAPGYYWYILEVRYDCTNGGDIQITENQFGVRSIITQVVKP